LEIAGRRKRELCASYTVVSLGLQAFVRNRALATSAADTPEVAHAPLAESAALRKEEPDE
jgi:hypothetical protein